MTGGQEAQSIPDTSTLQNRAGGDIFADRQLLQTYLYANMTQLHGIIRTYVYRLGLASGDGIAATAVEVLQETVVEALQHADRFVKGGQSMAWLLGVSLNVIRRKKVELAKRQRRELQFGSLTRQYPDALTESDLLDLLITPTAPGPEQTVEADEQADFLLALVSPDDREVLRLALLEDFDRQQLADHLGTSAGTARMRLHRALRRLRTAWQKQAETLRGENNV